MNRLKHTLLALATIIGGAFLVGNAYANEQYQEDVKVDFTFNPTLVLALSANGVSIADLAPGQSATSSDITITVTTNNALGYTLSATAGDGATYTNTNLVNGGAAFTSIATGTTVTTLGTDSTWGYSTNSGTSFSGLPYYGATAATLNQTKDSAGTAATAEYTGTNQTKFAIGAKAAAGQAAGEYKNVINFLAVTNVDSGGGQ